MPGPAGHSNFYDVVAKQSLPLDVQPLIVMEASTLICAGLKGDQALQKMSDLKFKCQKVGGVFSLLWHNSSLISEENRVLYPCKCWTNDNDYGRLFRNHPKLISHIYSEDTHLNISSYQTQQYFRIASLHYDASADISNALESEGFVVEDIIVNAKTIFHG